MAAKVVIIAEAVRDALNAGSFSQGFQADRTYRPARELTELAALRVTVVPRSIADEAASRSGDATEYGVDVAVRKKLSAEAVDAEADGLVALCEEIVAHFRRRRLAGEADAICSRTESVPVFSAEHLETSNVFVGVVTLYFKVIG